jgi:ribosomal protein S18 acetylase RimI-like enzyme
VIVSCEPWRALPPADVERILSAEASHWRAHLSWEVESAWQAIEPARVSGQLPGLVVRDDAGRVAGWTCYLLHRQTLQVAMIVADTPEAAEALVEGILRSPEAAQSSTQTVCIRDGAPGVRQVLARRGFDVTTYRYLERSISASHPAAVRPACRPWQVEDAIGTARLCARAYAGATEVRAFAPHGTMEEWIEYIATLVTGPGCGVFLADASFVIPGRQPRRLDGAIVTTDLGPGTAHIAQIAVDPDARGQGLARRLVESAIAGSAARGFRAVTLLVADDNVRAAALYERLEFRDRASFVVALRREPRRLRRVGRAAEMVKSER